MRQIIIRNSIEPSKTGNCTSFDDALCDSTGFVNFSIKKEKAQTNTLEICDDSDQDTLLLESMLIQNDMESPNILKDNVLYYMAGFIVNLLLTKLECTNCRSELLLDPDDKYAFRMPSYPAYAKFTRAKQSGCAVYPLYVVLKIVKATEELFKRRVVSNNVGITTERNLDLKIQYAVLEQLGPGIFNNSTTHLYDHRLGFESDHLTSLLKLVTGEYLKFRLKTYGKQYSEMVVHGNKPSLRHELTKTILFRNR